MPLDTGDIIIFNDYPGHVALSYDKEQAVHGNFRRDFHLEPLVSEKNNVLIHYTSGGKIYSFPWSKYDPQAKASYQANIRRVADRMVSSAKYGIYRAIRLQMGSSVYGPNSFQRLMKYRERMSVGGEKFVTTITCAEAVILCFQLTFLEMGGPGFIRLDAGHAMPDTLGKWLTANWGEPVAG